MWYTIARTEKCMREWRNWQTRTFEGRVVHTVRVQVPFLAPRFRASIWVPDIVLSTRDLKGSGSEGAVAFSEERKSTA